MFSHAIFESEEFRSYAAQLSETIRDTPEPRSLLLEQTVPVISEQLDVLVAQSVTHAHQIMELKQEVISIKGSTIILKEALDVQTANFIRIVCFY